MTLTEALAWLLLLLNICTFVVFAVDKGLSKTQKRRVPESTLLLLGFLGGALGGLLAMMVFRHKTKHKKFTLLLPLFLMLQVAAAVYFGLIA